jgi:acid stress-induced BolA-like protein IbaG/YrbA
MAIEAHDIEALIRAAFPAARITVQGDDGAHFSAEVYAALKGKMDGAHGELHALALTTKAPD